MKIIVDAMGGDNAPQAPVMGAVQANREYGVDIILVGRGEAILKVLEENGIQELPPAWRSPTPARWWRCATTRPPPSGRRRTPP